MHVTRFYITLALTMTLGKVFYRKSVQLVRSSSLRFYRENHVATGHRVTDYFVCIVLLTLFTDSPTIFVHRFCDSLPIAVHGDLWVGAK